MAARHYFFMYMRAVLVVEQLNDNKMYVCCATSNNIY